MRIVIFIILGVLVALVGGAAIFPMSVVADFAAKQAPDFRFAAASGSVWDGKLTNVSYGQQRIGDLSVKTDLMKLFGGKAGGTLGLAREGFVGQAGISYGLGDGSLELMDMKISGDTAKVPGMPQAIARADGKFTLAVKDLKFTKGVCDTATGEVWTDALTKVNVKGWVGPELRGPVTCEGGNLNVEAKGKAATGEDVLAKLSIGPKLDMAMTAMVANASSGAVEALTQIGFVAEGNALVMRQAMGSE